MNTKKSYISIKLHILHAIIGSVQFVFQSLHGGQGSLSILVRLLLKKLGVFDVRQADASLGLCIFCSC